MAEFRNGYTTHPAVPELLKTLSRRSPPYAFRLLNLSFSLKSPTALAEALRIPEVQFKVQVNRAGRPSGKGFATTSNLLSAQELITSHGRILFDRPLWIEILEDKKPIGPGNLQDLDPSILEISTRKVRVEAGQSDLQAPQAPMRLEGKPAWLSRDEALVRIQSTPERGRDPEPKARKNGSHK